MKRVKWAAAAMLAVATVVASQACASNDTQTAHDGSPVGNVDKVDNQVGKAGPVDLRTLLIPAGPDHPAEGKVIEVSFEQAATEGLLASPQGMTYDPDTCVNFIDMGGDPSTLNGWMQFNESSPVGKSHNLADDGFFVNVVIELPGADVDKIRTAATQCSDGSITLDWQGTKVTGDLVNTEIEAPALEGASVFAMEQRVAFDPPKDATTEAVLEQFYGKLGSDGSVLRIKYFVAVGIGDVLYLVNVEDEQFAKDMVTSFHEKAVAAGLTSTG